MIKVEIYTDGSVSGNGKPTAIGGWACILRALKDDELLMEKEYCGKLVYETDNCPITNNRAEMYAILSGLQAIEKRCILQVYSDSELCIKTLNGEYARKSNPDLWERLDNRCEELKRMGCSINFQWVKGHASNQFNNRCDKLASKVKKEGTA